MTSVPKEAPHDPKLIESGIFQFKSGAAYLGLKHIIERGDGIDYSHPLIISLIPNALYVPVSSRNVENEIVVGYEGKLPTPLESPEDLTINGQPFRVESIDVGARTVTLLGNEKALGSGVDSFQTKAGTWTFWYENRTLKSFSQPYKDSYAILVAIDDYDRRFDKLGRGPTGFRQLANMVNRADELADVLVNVGFDREHIKLLYNENATIDNIEKSLFEFWTNGEHASADLLFLYFGGHGGSTGGVGTGYLVTYDFQKGRPQTGILLSSIVAEHFPNIQARAVFVALDACDAGLALPGMLDTPPDQKMLARFATLAEIRAQTSDRARNLLVAGTGDEPAVDYGGGIFTRALIDGLRGQADFFGDGVIQFDELSIYVQKAVTGWAASLGVTQTPKSFIASQFGNGRVVFALKSWNQ